MKFCMRITLILLFFTAMAACTSNGTLPRKVASDTVLSVDHANRQAFGKYVEARVTDAFNGRTESIYPCGSRPAYYCKGLMVTAFEEDSAYVDNVFPKVGTDKQAFKPNYRCIFPVDGITALHSDDGCGAYLRDPNSAPCRSIGVTTAQQWLSKYQAVTNRGTCGFALDPASGYDKQTMDTVAEIATAIKKGGPGIPFFLFNWNEVVMGHWPMYAPGRIPLMAFFYVEDNSLNALVQAKPGSMNMPKLTASVQDHQRKFYGLTGIFVPIIQISAASEGAVFKYRDQDQDPKIPAIDGVFPG